MEHVQMGETNRKGFEWRLTAERGTHKRVGLPNSGQADSLEGATRREGRAGGDVCGKAVCEISVNRSVVSFFRVCGGRGSTSGSRSTPAGKTPATPT